MLERFYNVESYDDDVLPIFLKDYQNYQRDTITIQRDNYIYQSTKYYLYMNQYFYKRFLIVNTQDKKS